MSLGVYERFPNLFHPRQKAWEQLPLSGKYIDLRCRSPFAQSQQLDEFGAI